MLLLLRKSHCAVLRFPKITRSGDAQKEKTVTTQWRFSSKTCKGWGVAQPGGLFLSAKAAVKDSTFVPPRAGVCLDTMHKKGKENLKMSESWLLPLEIVIFVVVYYI